MKTSLLTGLMLSTALFVSTSAYADITIALQAPLTGSEADFGRQLRTGAEKVVADINAKGGVLGQKLILNLEDDKCDGTEATTVANRIAGSGAVFVVGSYCSGASIAGSAVYAESGIVQISPGATNPKLTDERPGPGVYRVCGRDDQQGPVSAKYILNHFAGKNVAILNDKSAYGEGIALEVQKAFEAGGGKPAMLDSFNKGDTDFNALITKMKAAKIDVIFAGTYQTEAATMLKQMRAQGLEAQVIGGDSMFTQQFWTVAGDAGEGMLMTFSPDPSKNPEVAGLVKEFTDAGYKPEGYTLYTYAAVQAWAAAVEKAGSTDFAAVTKALDEGSFDTVIGDVDFDEKGDVSLIPYVMYKWSKGTYDYAAE